MNRSSFKMDKGARCEKKRCVLSTSAALEFCSALWNNLFDIFAFPGTYLKQLVV